jgi:excisionase family DNA binding protein
MATSAELPQLLTMDQLAENLGVTSRHVRRLVDERRVPFLGVGRFIRFDPAEIAEWLYSRRVPIFGLSDVRGQTAVHHNPEGLSPPRPLQMGGPAGRTDEHGDDQ